MDFEAPGSGAIPDNALWLSWNLGASGWQHANGANTLFVYHATPETEPTQCYFLVDAVSSKWKPLAGDFSLALSSGYYSRLGSSSPWVHASISQQGLVPADTHSFTVLAEGDFSVSINSITVSMTKVGENAYAGDVSQFAGQVVTLSIANSSSKLYDPVIVDNMRFSSQPVPEPSTFALLGGGLLGFFALNRFRRK